MNAPQSSMRERVSAEEWQLRVDLAACYRLIALHGWDDLVFTHVSARLPGPEHHFLINPYGLMFEEITASSLVKVDMRCTPLLPTPYVVNPAGFVIHSAVHAARHDAKCVLHTHTVAGMAVASLEEGLLPLTQKSMRFYNRIGYHDYEGVADDLDECPRLVASLGKHNALILRNHGLLTCGPTVGRAFFLMKNLEKSCQTQLAAMASGGTLIKLSHNLAEHAAHQRVRHESDE
jgi:ribulose-5-phosphate 4-epimerase/fuculose-1-phosphate aldolase